MSPVPWATAEPGLVETVVAVMLSREHPRAQRIRPSQGDGGLDVIVPGGTAGAWDDYQVKCFATNLTSSQKSQIEASLSRVAALHADPDSGIDIERWFLTLPLDPTREQLTWFEGLVAALGVPFPCEWRGRAFVDGLAAKYPDVIDYYFRDGRDRLEQSIDRLRSLAGLGASAAPGMLVSPADAGAPLAELFRALNQDDPHFLYEFQVTERPPEPVPRERFVASVTQGSGTEYVTFHVVARYDTATDDRPVPLSFRLDPDQMDEAARAAWADAMSYGTPVELDGNAVPEITVDVPGGLGWTGQLTLMRMGPSASGADAPVAPLRLAILPPDRDVPLAEIVFVPSGRTVGPLGGIRLTGTDRSGLLSFEIRLDGPPDGSIHIGQSLAPWDEIAGRPVHEVVPVLEFAAEWHAPNRLTVGVEHGPVQAAGAPSLDGPPLLRRWVVNHARALAAISDRVGLPVSMPRLSDVTEDVHRQIVGTAQLVRGEDLDLVADGLVVVVPAAEAAAESAGPARPRQFRQRVTALVDGTERHLCDADLHLPACVLVPEAGAAGDGVSGVVMMRVSCDEGQPATLRAVASDP